ncbi:DUF1365 domain-containing protein [Pseudoxanthomonas gei]|uniref:DUF1365 domain-containing protein n=2 Tax=Pseudoxanthomonas gei TaxID=1383030 RepID=A0ABX0A793_9GAMM|nr:DUF1365 domain-containing protein [Pseudoxanthomonas gei]NDK37399.1 DUF1365 domain-containing protein [Pseudoxanthomonas gei]
MTLLRPAADPQHSEINACPRAADLASGLYTGWVRHRRHAPHPHAFRYRLFMAYLDLAEVEQVFAGRWLWSVGRRNVAEFRRSDYLGDPAVPLDLAVRDCVEQHGHPRPRGPIRLLAHLRYFGKCFNPVSFYYCFAEDGQTLDTVVAEITNTPWKQRYVYVLAAADANPHGRMHAWKFEKRFHVSPFMAMQHAYAWRLDVPGDSLHVHMDVLSPESQGDPTDREFDATLVLRRAPIDSRHLAAALLRFPLMTLQVLAAIHWQALRLWLRGNPVHDHPQKRISP